MGAPPSTQNGELGNRSQVVGIWAGAEKREQTVNRTVGLGGSSVGPRLVSRCTAPASTPKKNYGNKQPFWAKARTPGLGGQGW